MFNSVINLPPQQIPMSQKTDEWRRKHLDWADSKTFFNYSPVRNSVIHKKINYDLLNGKLHMEDLELIVNPEHIKDKAVSSNIQHYPIMNSKLNVLRGEESRRLFDYRVIVTNPNAISEIENNKRDAWYQALQKLVSDQSISNDDYQNKLQSMSDYFTYDWQDAREVRANAILNHYSKEYDFPIMFNEGFMDELTVGEEIYHCDIVGGEPIIERVNPLKIRVFRSGFSNKIEDADIIILEDYWSPSKVIDTYYDDLTKEDRDYIEGNSSNGFSNSNPTIGPGEEDERFGFIQANMIDDVIDNSMLFDPNNFFGNDSSLLPWDMQGNVRVLKVYWKSRRAIKKVKYYDKNGSEQYDFFPESYTINKALGEEEKILYINEAWEGTKIGDSVYVNMRPRVVQYNRLSNPSRCHFGFIGTIYNLNDSKPYSLVDIMKYYNYLYDIIQDRLNKLISKNWGKLLNLDMAKVPTGWTIDKWLYFAKHNSLVISDSFKEGNAGKATGVLSGAMNNNSTGSVDAELGNSIQSYLSILEYIKNEMNDVTGISKQREGQVSNRETVGGVERATLQSSNITEWLFAQHDSTKKRALECFLETAKIAMKGQSKKFSYILSDGSLQVATIDGDEFAECDYGLVVDNSNGTQELNQKLDSLAQAALQNQTINFSTVMKLFNSSSIAEKERMVANNEKQLQEMQQQQQQATLQQQQQAVESAAQTKENELNQKESENIRDNETKVMIAQLQLSAQNNQQPTDDYPQKDKDKQNEMVRQFDKRLQLEQDKLAFDKKKATQDFSIKNKQLKNKNNG